MIGNDSGGIHAAAAFQIPSFSVIFGTEFGRFLPNPYYLLNHSFYSGKDCLRCLGECVFPKADNQPFPCLLDVSVDEVYRAIRAFLTAEGNA